MSNDSVTDDGHVEFSDVPAPVRPPDKAPRWPWFVAGSFVVVGLIIAILWPITIPFYTVSPGPVYDTSDFVTVPSGHIDNDGELFFLTVSLKEANVFEWAAAKLDPSVDIRKREVIRPTGVSQEQLRRESLAAMEQAKTDAKFVALTKLGYDVTLIGTGALVIETLPESGAQGILQADDIIVEMDGEEIAFRDDIAKGLEDAEIGDTVHFVVERPVSSDDGDGTSGADTERVELDVVLGPHVDDPTRPMIGILLDNNEPIVEFPVEVDIDSRNIGGPSAGMMFTLQIMDQLTEEELTHSKRIAGTGTIDRNGHVGAIGGVKQKVYAAIDAGAVAVLVPGGNYDDAVVAAGDDIEVVKVEHIDDALAFLDSL